MSVFVLLFGCIAALPAAEPAATPKAVTPQADPDRAAIEKAIAAYVAAFNKGDAAALAALWTEQGELVTPKGKKVQGTKDLAEQFGAYFAATKGAKLELSGTKIELQSPSVAIETGTARVIAPDSDPEDSEYKAIHVKTAAGWRLDSVREVEPEGEAPSHYEDLKGLAWMIGEWSDTDENVEIRTSCRWTSNQNFIVQTFKVYSKGSVDFEGTQIIGWDPNAKTIRSWVFDSDGGFGSGVWKEGKDRWTVQTLSVLPDGRRGSSTNTYEIVDAKTVKYRSIGRQVDGELLPSIGPVNIVRSASN